MVTSAGWPISAAPSGMGRHGGEFNRNIIDYLGPCAFLGTFPAVGIRKHQRQFWSALKRRFRFDNESTLLADDKEDVLASAESFGIRHLIHIGKPNSHEPYTPSERFRSIAYFNELFPFEG